MLKLKKKPTTFHSSFGYSSTTNSVPEKKDNYNSNSNNKNVDFFQSSNDNNQNQNNSKKQPEVVKQVVDVNDIFDIFVSILKAINMKTKQEFVLKLYPHN